MSSFYEDFTLAKKSCSVSFSFTRWAESHGVPCRASAASLQLVEVRAVWDVENCNLSPRYGSLKHIKCIVTQKITRFEAKSPGRSRILFSPQE
jgi:hypothetical protein